MQARSTFRFGILLLGALLIGGVLRDPYTFHLNASDYVAPAPTWQVALGLLDVALLVLSIVTAWRGRLGSAFTLLVLEALFALTLAAALVARDGVARFVTGLGAEQYLTEYFALIGLRFVLLTLVRAFEGRQRAAAV